MLSSWLLGAVAVAAGLLVAVLVISYALGVIGASLAAEAGVSPAVLLLTAAPHAVLELTAVFLPLAAWTLAGRRGEWDQLLAATLITVAVAIPMLVVSATWEAYVWPAILDGVSTGR